MKARFPDVEISVRRDNDGFALIKTLYRPTYKYDLDKILSFDMEEKHREYKESAEIILKNILSISADEAKNPSKLTKEQLQRSI